MNAPSDQLREDINTRMQTMLNPVGEDSVIDTCADAMPFFIDSLAHPQADIFALADALRAIAFAMDIAEVFPFEETPRRPWEFYLASAAIRSQDAENLRGWTGSFFDGIFCKMPWDDRATQVLAVALLRATLALSPEYTETEYFKKRVRPKIELFAKWLT